MSWLLFILILKSFFGIILAACPNGTVQSITNQNVCYLFSHKKHEYLNAESICIQNNGHLASINSMFENVFVKEQAQLNFSGFSEFWIGATNLKTPGTWGWIDNSPFTFTDWHKGEPKNKKEYDCGAMKLHEGTWMSEKCDKTKPFVCMITMMQIQTTMPPITTKTSTSTIAATTTTATTTTPRPVRTTQQMPKYCPDAWVFSSDTGFCYRVLTQYTWIDAENTCASQNAHLASIHTEAENKFLNGLIPFNNECQIYAWIGSHYAANSSTWQWTDNTPFDYTDWVTGRPLNVQEYQCGDLEDGKACSASPGSWANGHCYSTFSYAICKKQPL